MPSYETVAAILQQCGIASYGFCSYHAVPERLPCRAAAKLPSDPQSVVMCAFPYYLPDVPAGNVARFAALPDYHKVVGECLERCTALLQDSFPEESFFFFVDQSPLPEKRFAVAAGLGVMGTNQLFLHYQYGSYCFLGEIVTTLTLPAMPPPAQHCENCGRCVAACPTKALGEEGFQKERCISFLTQKKGTLTPHEAALIRRGDSLWGCDLCQRCCPHNRELPAAALSAFAQDCHPTITRENLDELLLTRPFAFRGKAVMLRNLALWEQSESSQTQPTKEEPTMHLSEITQQSQPIFDGKILHLRKDTVLLENGAIATREVIHHSGGVTVVALTPEEEVYLVRQYRYPMQQALLELPAGKKGEDEEPLACGKRELEEECGIVAARYTSLGSFFPSPAYLDEVIHLYLAQELTETKAHLDEDEFLDVVKMPLQDAVQMVLDGRIRDGKTQAALLKVWVLRHPMQK